MNANGYPVGAPEIDEHALMESIREYFPVWILFDTIGRRHRKYTCSHCGHTWEHDGRALRDIDTPHDLYWDCVTVNDRVACPKCNHIGYVKNRKTFDVPYACRAIAVHVPVSADEVWIRCFFFEKNYSVSDTYVSVTETEIYRLTPGKAEFWEKGYGQFCSASHIREPFSYNHGKWCEKYDYMTSWEARNGIRSINDTFLRYSAFEKYAYRYPAAPNIKYLCAYARFPQIEVLCKVGVFDAVRELVESGKENRRVMDWTAKTPWGMHRLSKQEYKIWTSGKYHADLQTLKMYKRIKGKGERDFETAKQLLNLTHGFREAERLIVLGRTASKTPRDILKYMERIMEDGNESACRWAYVTVGTIYCMWSDWMSMIEKEGLAGKVNPFPKDLKKEHDAAVERANAKRRAEDLKRQQARIEEQERKYKDVTEIYHRIADKYAYQNDTYAVVVPDSASAVIEEGIVLHHCVGTSERYFERVRRNETFVLFLRRVSNISKPWYTLEVEPGGTIRQKRTMHDEQNDDLKAAEPFLREWQGVVAKRMTGDDLAQAMAARRMRITEMEELDRTGTTVKFGRLRGKRLHDVLAEDLMEQVYLAKTNGDIVTEINEREEKQA